MMFSSISTISVSTILTTFIQILTHATPVDVKPSLLATQLNATIQPDLLITVTPTPVLDTSTLKVQTWKERLVSLLKTKLGLPYVWGATGPSSFDCSGLAQWVYRQLGILIPRTTWGMLNAGQSETYKNIQVGDLILYSNGSHVGIYIGDNKIIHSPCTGDVVKQVNALSMTPYSIRRIIPK